jgi:bifunctional non-homologous end joining protein LigD
MSIASLVKELKNPRDSFAVEADGHEVSLTHLDKELWPRLGGRPALTKRDLLIYLARVSPHLLRHLHDRPLTLSRYPDGIGGEHFFQKHWHSPVPDFVATVGLSEESKEGEYLLCNNLATLLWLGQVADLEFHAWFSRISPGPDTADRDADSLTRYPDFIVFDLDPYIYSGKEPKGAEPELNRKAFDRTCQAALWLKESLDELSLASFIKTSGKTGLHIHVPIVRQLEYAPVRAAAKTICQAVLRRHPGEITTEWAVEKRAGKVFLDYNQNVRGKTLAAIYSPRPTPGATVSAPLRWDELGKVYPTDFTILNIPGRLARLGDLWRNMMKSRGDLRQLLKL